ncbi:MAG: hypothetical protein ACRD3O_04585 [Terriglobia bacterium]
MLEKVGLLTAAESRVCLSALAEVDRATIAQARYLLLLDHPFGNDPR